MQLSPFKKRLFVRAVFLAALLVVVLVCAGASFSSQGGGEPKKDWYDLATSLDDSGNRVYTKVFGFFATDDVFIVCDPDTGQELDRAYITQGAELGKRPIYGSVKGEDKKVVKRVDPVTVRLFAPNVWGSLKRLDDNFDYYTATGWSEWPGGGGIRVVPGSDPDYWLMVVEVFNPNPWPVKAVIRARISGWRFSVGDTATDPVSIEKEIRLGGGDTKYVLLNRGAKEKYFIDALHGWGEGEVWSEGYYETRVTENGDPELPPRLQSNLGYIDFIYYEEAPPQPKDFSGGIPEGLKPQTGPYRNLVDATGPALISYNTREATWGGSTKPTVPSDGSRVPVLKYYPIYVEMWRFKPDDDDPDTGRLEKEVVPGIAVRASSIAKPRVELTSTLLGSSVESDTKSGQWVIKINYHVTVNASNPDSDVSVEFSSTKLVAPNVQDALYEFERRIREKTGISEFRLHSPAIHSIWYKPSFVSFDSVTLGPGESKQLFDADLAVEIKFSKWQTEDNGDTVYITQKDIEYALGKVIDKFNWSGEAAFSQGRITLVPDESEYEKVLGLSRAIAYRKEGSRLLTKNVGLYPSDGSKWFTGAPVFNCEGVPMKAGDELWRIMMYGRSLSGWIEQGNGLWPVWQ